MNAAFKIFVKIGIQRPKNMRDSIKKEHVIMLIFMNGFINLGMTMSQNWCLCNIVVKPVNVSIRMMDNVVFNFPNKSVGSERIHRKTHDVIDAFTFRITTMVGIMHYIKSN